MTSCAYHCYNQLFSSLTRKRSIEFGLEIFLHAGAPRIACGLRNLVERQARARLQVQQDFAVCLIFHTYTIARYEYVSNPVDKRTL